MSFQDFGKQPRSNINRPTGATSNGAAYPIMSTTSGSFDGGTSSSSYGARIGATAGVGYNGMNTTATSGDGSGSGGGAEYAALSDAILQYQRNIGILGKIVENIGMDNDAETQYKVQTDVIKHLTTKIEQSLSTQTQTLTTLQQRSSNNNDASNSTSTTTISQNRATLIKLTRDYRRVEATFKNIQLEYRRRMNVLEVKKKMVVEEENRKRFEKGIDQDASLLQMQLHDDRINEEIMREREEEIRNINKGMHQVNEIYKDLAQIVSTQQDHIDEVEIHMENAQKNTESGLTQIEKAKAKATESSCVIS